ncbi:type IV secretory system conjugative DNA transfer family protein [Senegalimassilia faecalis]|uniref:type IV secretory system conjugative DNA transfer family protein n=1 Tax=Senegalimassilia faecalis TaxID=2509433 RepID=UPI003A96CE0B
MRAVKSYNKIPRPFFDFWACFGALWLALLAALQCGAVGGLVRDIGPFLRALNLPSEGFADLGLAGSMLASAALSAPVSAAFAAYSYMSFHNGVWMGKRPSADRSYGSSRLESRPFALRRVFEECDEDGGVPGLVVGSVGSDGGSVLVDDIGHAIVLGGTGSGKTTGCLLQTIVNLVRSEASFVSLDPKGELFDVTAAYAKESGYKLVCIDFSDPARSDGWLPLQEAVDCVKARKGRTRAELAHEVRMLSSVLVPDSRDSSPI